MPDPVEFQYDAASALSKGGRELQEDAVTSHFPAGAGHGFVVLADGMGGHAAGDVASTLVVQEVTAALRPFSADPEDLEASIGPHFDRALERANAMVARRTAIQPELHGMGATLVASLIVGNRLYWISVGDSPLYLLRGLRLSRLNQEHSLARRMDRMVSNGLMTRGEADENPDRDCLTSVIHGEAIAEIDRRDHPLDLMDGDIVIVASDGLQTLSDSRIAALVHASRSRPSAEILARLLNEINGMDDPDQDNVSICVVKIAKVGRAAPAAAPPSVSVIRTSIQLRVQGRDRHLTARYSSDRKG